MDCVTGSKDLQSYLLIYDFTATCCPYEQSVTILWTQKGCLLCELDCRHVCIRCLLSLLNVKMFIGPVAWPCNAISRHKVYQSMTEGRQLDLKLLTFYGVVTTPLNRWSLAFVTLQIQSISKSWKQSMIRIRWHLLKHPWTITWASSGLGNLEKINFI